MIKVHILKVQKFNYINYCYIIAHIEQQIAILVDPAWQPELIQKTLSQYNLKPIAILLTHYHHDHVHLAPYFAEYYHIPVYISHMEMDYYQFSCPNLLPIINNQLPIKLGPIEIKAIFTPGHTYGGLCYLIENNLFAGDTLFNEGCGMCLGRGADPYQMYASLQKLKNMLHPEVSIYPGHCYKLPPGQLFKVVLHSNIYLSFSNPEDFVTFRMRKQQKGLFNFI